MNIISKPGLVGLSFLLALLCLHAVVMAQPATVSYPFAVGTTSCGSGTQEIHFYNYNETTNIITSITSTTATNPVRRYTPQLRIGTTNSSGQRFTSSVASVSFNPKDHKIYYFWTAYGTSNSITQGVPARTFAWSWPVGTQPLSTAPRLDTIRSFASDILGVAFDNEGNGYMIEFTNALPTSPPTYKAMIRSINFSTGALGMVDTLELTGGAKIYKQGSGDVVMTPSGQMFFVVDNKLFTPNYKAYTGTGSKITCTYVDTVINSATGYFVGLTYAQGETISAYSNNGCPFYETNMLTAATSNVTKSGTVYAASDMATVVTGIGAAKRLVSVTPTGTPGQYTVVYDVYVKNYGNTDVTNVQVTDDLTQINGAANVSNVTASFVGTAPAGITLNSSYNGNSNRNLLTGTGTLPNYPVANSSFTIRISCTLSNIANSTLYYNSAIATATGFNNEPLRDVSTNGSVPDLNMNDKPDDEGEDQPTPFLVGITAQTPPCASLSQLLYSQNFGMGANSASLPAGTSAYTGSTTHPLGVNRFLITSNANEADNTRFLSLTDHTGNPSGRMLVVNADASSAVLYSGTINSICAGQQYSLIFYAASVANPGYKTVCDGFGGIIYPKVKMRIKDPISGAIITEISTTEITGSSWTQYGMKWVMPSGFSTIVFELINDAPGGCGNDIAIDDIQLGTCDPLPVVSISGSAAGCIGGSTVMNAELNDAGVIPGIKEYQWQVSADGLNGWADIAAATNATYTINNVTTGEANKYYRVIVAAQGNMSSPGCRYTSPAFLLVAKTASMAPTGATASANNVCPGELISLSVQGGTLGTNAQYRWYSSSCGGTLVGNGPSITVSPSTTTTYYVRIEGDCNATACAAVTVTIACDIDLDDDGIPDVVEGTDDSDGDGIPNYLDLDSDNDGIPDVVEAGGVDADGDGKIDNFIDIDNDGLSDNVDGNLFGHLSSGLGLGLPDYDGDGIPNFLDLDSDNDGIPDLVEVYGVDANNDGRVDNFKDTDNDGWSDDVDGDVGNKGLMQPAINALLLTGSDTDGNGRANSYPFKNIDQDARPNPYDLDSDGDGILDVIEAGFADSNFDGQADGSLVNGWSAAIRGFASLTLPNHDGTGRPDVYDIDADDDGIPDNIEGQTTAGYDTPVFVDADGDGIDNAFDNYFGFGGNGINPVNTDGDAWPDYLDTDSDGDGYPDVVEGNDFNGNYLHDDDVSLTGMDSDDDGLDDRFDADHTSARGTSRFMGKGGSLNGPNAPGSRCSVHRSNIAHADRDWRMVAVILETRFLNIMANKQGNNVQLSWTVANASGSSYYIIERSTNGNHFVSIGRIEALSGVKDYTARDTESLNSSKVFYRIRLVEVTGKTIFSSIATVVNNPIAIQVVRVYPNPASHYINIELVSDVAANAHITIRDVNGKQVDVVTKAVQKGVNTFYHSLSPAMPSGTYLIELRVAEVNYVYKLRVK